MGRVFVPYTPMVRGENGLKYPRIDLTPASAFGEIVMLLDSTNIPMAEMNRIFFNKMEDFNDDDYIVAVGDPTIIAAVAMVASEINDGVVSMLVWDRFARKYQSTTIVLNTTD